jgi:hypothetical protein
MDFARLEIFPVFAGFLLWQLDFWWDSNFFAVLRIFRVRTATT